LNGGAGGGAYPEQIEKGTTLSEPTEPTRANCTFGGWYENSGLTTPYTFGDPVTDDITLYAKWTTNGGASLLIYGVCDTVDLSNSSYHSSNIFEAVWDTNIKPDAMDGQFEETTITASSGKDINITAVGKPFFMIESPLGESPALQFLDAGNVPIQMGFVTVTGSVTIDGINYVVCIFTENIADTTTFKIRF